MSPRLPTRCTHVDPGSNVPCDDWAEDGDRCDTHPRRPQRAARDHYRDDED